MKMYVAIILAWDYPLLCTNTFNTTQVYFHDKGVWLCCYNCMKLSQYTATITYVLWLQSGNCKRKRLEDCSKPKAISNTELHSTTVLTGISVIISIKGLHFGFTFTYMLRSTVWNVSACAELIGWSLTFENVPPKYLSYSLCGACGH